MLTLSGGDIRMKYILSEVDMESIILKSGKVWPLNTAYEGDCLDFMRELPDKCIDLCIADPPYRDPEENQPTKDMRNNGSMKNFGDKFTEDQYNEILRISKHQIIWGVNNYDFHKSYKGFIVWKKKTISDNFTMSMAEIASISEGLGTTSKLFEIQPQDKERFHPTQKPLPLFKWCLEKYAPENAIVFDPFLGSFTTAVACHHYGLKWFGCEKDPDYFKAGVERYDIECLQNMLDF